MTHPYQEQFSVDLDCDYTDWADSFVMLASTPRCGSHFLGHSLMDNGECGVPLEYLNPKSVRNWSKRFSTESRSELFTHFVQNRTTPNGRFCFKAHWTQFRPFSNRITKLTRGLGLDNIIFIQRRDILRQSISLVIAKQTGAWISGAPEKKVAKYDYEEIVKAAKSIVSQNGAWKQYIQEQNDVPTYEVFYEDLVSAEREEFTRITEFLRLSRPLKPPKRTEIQRNNRSKDWYDLFLKDLKSNDSWIIKAS